MAGRGEAGVDVRLDRVPLREPDLEPVEIMISESQERMVAIVDLGRLGDVRAVPERWELECAEIGEVTESGELRAFFGDEEVGAIDAASPTRRRATGSSRGRRRSRRRSGGRTSPSRTTSGAPGVAERPQPARVWERSTTSSGRAPSAVRGWTYAVLRLRPAPRARRVARRPGTRRAVNHKNGRHERRARGRAQRRARRRPATRDHELLELRQPREGRGRLGA